MTGKEIIENGIRKLSAAGIESAEREAAILLSEITGCSSAGCYLLDNIDFDTKDKYIGLIKRRCAGEPLQIIIGEWEFYGRPIRLRETVFIPRPETEGLVELVLKHIQQDAPAKGLEIGVGSGAISINLLAERPELLMVGCDISEEALALTRENAEFLNVSERLALIKTDVAETVEGVFDFVVSNPPYVTTEELEGLSIEVKNEPRQALDGGDDGLRIIKSIIETTTRLIKPGGFIALEIHERLGEEVKGLMEERSLSTETYKDLSGKNRYALAFKEV
ncbi:peptide chain release factor N(5)-glutamine methyltransferase [bacterium]|nr:MAG: peptide chain release factor N(5)-glutamine methyltransferase [bacterium]